MDHAALASAENAANEVRWRMSIKGLLVAVALCAFIVCAGLSIRDHFEGYPPLHLVRTGNAIERRKAVQDLSDPDWKIGEETAMTALMPALGDEDAGVRAAAAEALGLLIWKLRNHLTTAPVASELGKRHIDVAMRELVRLLSDRDFSVRAAAATGLGTMARGPSVVASPTAGTVAVLKRTSNAAGGLAAKVIGDFRDLTLPPELVGALSDKSAQVRAAAAGALVSFGPDLDLEIPTLFAMLERDETNVQKACRQALESAWPSPELVPALSRFLQSGDRGVRGCAALLLGRIGPEARRTIPALVAILNERIDAAERDRSDAVTSPGFPAFCAVRALAQMGPSREAIAALAELISPERIERYLALSRTNSHVGPQRGVDPVEPMQAGQMFAAVRGLGEIGPPAAAAVPALISAFNRSIETDWVLSQEAIPVAIARIAPNSPAAPAAVAVLIRGLDAKNQSNRVGAADALGKFGTDAAPAIPRLRALQNDPDRSVRDAAMRSLAALEVQAGSDAGGERVRLRP
jgi:HEAT repeat protein